jgi:hypothetical protein
VNWHFLSSLSFVIHNPPNATISREKDVHQVCTKYLNLVGKRAYFDYFIEDVYQPLMAHCLNPQKTSS